MNILKWNNLFATRISNDRFSRYIVQCGLAIITLATILLLAEELLGIAIIVAIGSTVFTIFVVPVSVASSARFVFGFAILGLDLDNNGSNVTFDLIAALAVGVGILFMVLANAPHPPTAGTILGLLANGWDVSVVLFVLLSSISLVLIKLLFGHRLVNLI